MDISKLFQDQVKKCRVNTGTSTSPADKQRDLQNKLFKKKSNNNKDIDKDKDKENEKDKDINSNQFTDKDILKASASILENIESLKEFLNDNREAYIDTSKHVSSSRSSSTHGRMTDEDRDTVDNLSLKQIEVCNNSIAKLDGYIRRNFIANPKYRQYESVEQVPNPSILRDDPDNEKFYKELEQFDNKIYMFMSIIDQLRLHLNQVSTNFKKQRDFRLATIKENQKFASSITDSTRNRYNTYSSKSNSNSSNSKDSNNSSVNSNSNLAELLGEDDRNQQVYKDIELDNDEQLIFEQQNASLINELESLSDQILVIERQIEELSTLFDEITPHIMAQRETLNTIYTTNVQATNYIHRANQHIQDATKKTFDFRVMVLVLLITASFVLLFLNYYQQYT
ncbi:hypothetical protein PPL_05918 [Heterostelium album PN500]|uniref:SNARE-complex protein Syntaxin-18 N-terminal domain-containing protein n=1 Tax=Heterostelium pallidum (strain ATCC 26659 / Pp 5 / PN500) TaxID=670386 RepID=D3BBP9_HETP5|nr:hypothetical protein PPL_05918 [Heterostelium album PN500]EFA81082.1 hypothetical protein PPL_05918 [Heterostelium album PN500]|eukprot:XP_020433200.1 hypothetical protein PPL_05918 [Heterostelium album PN500]